MTATEEAEAMTHADLLVIGGTGVVGGSLVRCLLDAGRSVRALLRPGSDGAEIERKGVAIVCGDLTDSASLDKVVDGVSAIVTTAAGREILLRV